MRLQGKLIETSCHDVLVEPPLQPITEETFQLRSANQEDCGRLDMAMSGSWNTQQHDFLDVRLFPPFSASNNNCTMMSCYRLHEAEKRGYIIRGSDMLNMEPLHFWYSLPLEVFDELQKFF